MTDRILIQTDDMDIAVSKEFPAVIVAPTDRSDQLGYGLVVSAALGYNATPDGMLQLEDVPYHASFEHATWVPSSVSHDTDDERGETVTVELTSSINMNRKNPASPGNIIIEDWAEVTVRFQVASINYSARYEGVDSSPDYHVNGTTELKLDIIIDVLQVIDVQNLSIDMALMMTEDDSFSPTSMPEQYVFHGYQEDEVTESDPLENETDGGAPLLHVFHPRDDFKQLFTLIEDGKAESYFGWAKQAEIGYIELAEELVDLSTYYRTDGDSLRIYLSTPINSNTTTVFHDPSLGLLDGDLGHIDLPDNGLIVGYSGESAALGVVAGVVVAGVVVAYAVARRQGKEDPGEVVDLEENRYYRKKP